MPPPSEIYDRRYLPAGHVLAKPGDAVRQLFLVCKGSVTARTETSAQKAILGPGSVLGLADILEGNANPQFKVHAEALTGVEVICLGARQTAQEIADLSPQMRLILVAMFRSGRHIIAQCEKDAKRLDTIRQRAEQALPVAMNDTAGGAAVTEWESFLR
jgi:CRP-like cAMP-binding protein